MRLSITDESFSMSFLRRIMYVLWYFRRPPWDSGVTPPELLDFLKSSPIGRVIDLGCGTGTNAITLARLGWQVTGVDFIPMAIEQARKKARQAGVQVNLCLGDVTRLDGIDGFFDFALDLGCYHSLTVQERKAYLHQLERVLAPGGIWFVYAFLSSPQNDSGVGLSPGDLEQIQTLFRIYSRRDGYNRGDQPSAYFIFKKFNIGE
jgi:ubiquinone/menaquinone biosynthesis C-methylase UbiE